MRERARVIVVMAAAVAGLGVVGAVWARRGAQPIRLEPPMQRVHDALTTTLAADRWDMTYALTNQPGPGGAAGMSITGTGTTNLHPYAMVSRATAGGFGQITTYMDGSHIWEFGGAAYGTSGPGSSIAGFAPTVEGTLGPEEGAVAMLGLGSASGYLDLVGEAITTADATGTATVDGVPVTVYRVAVDPSKLATVALTSDEASAVADALRLLDTSGFRTMTDTVSVDGEGRIRALTEVVTFADGGVVTDRTTMSDFGTAPTVTLP